jgi:hypothetical protein
MTQKLITAAITNASKKFGLYSQDGKRGQSVVLARFFTPASNMTWYMTEFDPETGDGFGVVVGQFTELGYFNVNEMQNAKMQSGLFRGMQAIERDIHVAPKKQTLIECMKSYGDEIPSWLLPDEED